MISFREYEQLLKVLNWPFVTRNKALPPLPPEDLKSKFQLLTKLLLEIELPYPSIRWLTYLHSVFTIYLNSILVMKCESNLWLLQHWWSTSRSPRYLFLCFWNRYGNDFCFIFVAINKRTVRINQNGCFPKSWRGSKITNISYQIGCNLFIRGSLVLSKWVFSERENGCNFFC